MADQEQPEVHDPALDVEETEVPGDRDDVDVPLALMNKDTADGEGDEEPSESDFVSYASDDADKEETG